MKKVLLIVLLCLVALPVFAKHAYKEKDYQDVWCKQHNGIKEVVLDDKARVDCLTSDYAVEVDFSPKWAESVGQALYYSIITGKKPAVLLILENGINNVPYLFRINTVARKYNIKVFYITTKDLEKWYAYK